jgi:hypothetical protein
MGIGIIGGDETFNIYCIKVDGKGKEYCTGGGSGVPDEF